MSACKECYKEQCLSVLAAKSIFRIPCQYAWNITKTNLELAVLPNTALHVSQFVLTKSSSTLSIADTMSHSQPVQKWSLTVFFLNPFISLTSNRSTPETPTCQTLNQLLLSTKSIYPHHRTLKPLLQPRHLPTMKQTTNAPAAHPTRPKTGSAATATPAP